MPDDKKGGGKALGITGGGGAGVFLLKFAGLISDPTLRDLYISAIPIVSVLLSEVFTLAWVIYGFDPKELRVKRRLKKLKRQAEAVLKSDPPVSQDIKEKAQARYDVICQIEMGILPFSVLEAPSSRSEPQAQETE
ncbi:hypothetical protein [Plesiomonas shigelloides]|uniref:Uncharacterized protein n=1 Tax=Plesiomonas shigelloides TaxID=703 RepID=A0A8I1WAQ9_PLESH|nr:hypothetical protein [Plesiomonas shigelloides]MBO1109402.1 hypothetical protein [Plesiomonas shigelloides]